MPELSFILAAAIVLVTPGPTNTVLAAYGAAMGLRRAGLLPLAEAAAYAIAISAFAALSETLRDVPAAMPAMRAVAAAWLFYSAARLWSMPVVPHLPDRRGAFGRVFATTLLNPKAMLVGTILIPGLLPHRPGAAIALFVLLSILAGACWIGVGAMLPGPLRRHSYKGAAVIVAGFALTAAASALPV